MVLPCCPSRFLFLATTSMLLNSMLILSASSFIIGVDAGLSRLPSPQLPPSSSSPFLPSPAPSSSRLTLRGGQISTLWSRSTRKKPPVSPPSFPLPITTPITTLDLVTDFFTDVSDGDLKDMRKTYKKRNSVHIKRKIFHISLGLVCAYLCQRLHRDTFLPISTFITTTLLSIELLRYIPGFRWINKVYHAIFGMFLRSSEMEDGRFCGVFYYALGINLTVYLFPTAIAVLGIVQLAIADPGASYFGNRTKAVKWSRIEDGFYGIGRNKGILGFLGGALLCVPFNYRLLQLAWWSECVNSPQFKNKIPVQVTPLLILTASILIGLAGSFADLIVPTPVLTMPSKIMGYKMPRMHVDDNTVVPIMSAWAATGVFWMLGMDAQVKLGKFLVF